MSPCQIQNPAAIGLQLHDIATSGNHAFFTRKRWCLYIFSFLVTLVMVTLVPIPVLSGSSEIDSLNSVLGRQTHSKDRISSLSALGRAYYVAGDHKKALETNKQLLELVSKHGTRADSAKAFRNIGLVMMEMSWYDESLDYLTRAVQLYRALGDSSREATCLMNVGIVHDFLENRPMSLSYYNTAMEYFKKLGDETGIANCKLNIGIILTKQKQYNQAVSHFLEAIRIYEKTGNKSFAGAAYINLALALKNLKNFDQAEEYLNKAQDIYLPTNDMYHLCVYNLNMGELLIQRNKLKEALPFLIKARELSEQTGSMEHRGRAYEFLSDYYLKMKDFKNAYDMLLKSKTINDSVLNAETVKKVSQIQYHYEIARRDAENSDLVKQNLQKELKLTQRTTMIYIMLAVIMLIVILVVLLLLWNRSKHKANLELEAKNRLIGAQKEELIKLNASKDKFLSILAHDIKNPLSAILGISDILNTDYSELTEEERQGFIKDIYTSSSNLFEIVNTLLNWSISQNGMISYQPKEFGIAALCQSSVNKLQPIAKMKDISLQWEESDEIKVYADDNMIMSVVHNLLSNAIKYSHRGGQIRVHTSLQDGMARVAVQDDGVGLSAENQAKLFRIDQSVRSKGTTGETGTGIGLILCKDFVDRNKGVIGVESREQAGSTFYFTLPLANA